MSSVVKWKIKQDISHVTVQAWHCTDIRYQPLYTGKCDVIVFKFRIVNNFKLRSMVFMNQMLVKTGIKTSCDDIKKVYLNI